MSRKEKLRFALQLAEARRVRAQIESAHETVPPGEAKPLAYRGSGEQPEARALSVTESVFAA